MHPSHLPARQWGCRDAADIVAGPCSFLSFCLIVFRPFRLKEKKPRSEYFSEPRKNRKDPAATARNLHRARAFSSGTIPRLCPRSYEGSHSKPNPGQKKATNVFISLQGHSPHGPPRRAKEQRSGKRTVPHQSPRLLFRAWQAAGKAEDC